jgi:hypothetical protein
MRLWPVASAVSELKRSGTSVLAFQAPFLLFRAGVVLFACASALQCVRLKVLSRLKGSPQA